jgi:hypothetical protein
VVVGERWAPNRRSFMDKLTIGFLLIALVFSGIHIGYIMKMNDNATYKYTRLAVPILYLVGFMGYLLLLFYISNKKEYTLHILYGILMLICLPAVLFSASVATIIGGNI